MSILFEVSVLTINEHLANIFKSCELRESATIRKFRIVQTEGNRQINREIDFYNLDTIIAVGFRVNSERATQFRQWAIAILRDFSIRGYVLDKERLKNGAYFTKEYFAKAFAESEFEKYHIKQDRLYESDFDLQIKKLLEQSGSYQGSECDSFDPINPKDHILNFVPPQSFCYTDTTLGWKSARLTSGGGQR